MAERNVRLHCELSGPAVKSPGHSDDWKCVQSEAKAKQSNIVHLKANFLKNGLLGHEQALAGSFLIQAQIKTRAMLSQGSN